VEQLPRRGGVAGGGSRATLLEQRFETFEVELTRLHAKPVARLVTLDPVAAKQRSQP